MSDAHAFLAPSSAHIRQKCAAAARMMASYPKPDSEESIAGTTAHWVGFCMIRENPLIGYNTPKNVDLSLVDDEMIEACEVYYSDIIARVPDLQGLHLEATIECNLINEQVWGTPDAWHLSDRTDKSKPWTLTVWDFKFGHRYVPAFENWQLIEYVAGILEACDINGADDHYLTVDLRVVQPRCFVGGASVRSWRIRATDLRGYFNTARMFEEKSLDPSARATSNEHCRDCVPLMCSTAQAAAYNGIDVSMDPQPFGLSAEALGLELRKVKRAIEALEARETALDTQALEFIKAGTAVPGFGAQSVQSREKWTDAGAAEIAILGEVLGVTVTKPTLLTPNQVVKAGIPAELVEPLKFRPVGALKLVQDDGTTARKVFGGF